MATAIQHKISDTVKMHIDDSGKHPVVEIEFRFIRYRLMIDDLKWTKELLKLIDEVSKPEMKKKGEKPTLPRFYKSKGGEQL